MTEILQGNFSGFLAQYSRPTLCSGSNHPLSKIGLEHGKSFFFDFSNLYCFHNNGLKI